MRRSPRHRHAPGSFFIVFVLLFLGPSCGEDQACRPNDTDPYQWDDDRIRELVYSAYSYPSGFYQEDLYGGYPYYENTISIFPLDGRPDARIELCTTDRDQAFAWSESSAVNSSIYYPLIAERETEKYFEFRRIWLDYPEAALLSRVHKCAYLDRSMYDRHHPSPVLGIFKKRPLTSGATTELIEYMWFSGLVGIPRQVLCSRASETSNAFVQTILYTIRLGTEWGMCDEINLKEARFMVAKRSGEITAEDRTVRVIVGRCHPNP
jgi:hypothetical protein